MKWPWRREQPTFTVHRLPSPERAKPDNEQVSSIPLPALRWDVALPPCAPYPEHEPHEYRGACFQCSGNTKASLLHLLPDHDCARAPYWEVFKTDALVGPEPEDVPPPRLSLAVIDQGVRDALTDATETIPNPLHTKETPMTTDLVTDAGRDARERERVEQIILRQWETAARATVDAALAKVGEVLGVDLDNPAPEYDMSGFWATLTDEQQAEALAPALELYRAGRDDQEAER